MKTVKGIITTSICVLFLCGCGSIQRAADEMQQNSNSANSAFNSELSEVKIGMTEAQVVGLLGSPSGNDVTRTAAGKSEQWIYTGQQIITNAGVDFLHCTDSVIWHYQNVQVYLYFENGILTSMQGF